jgi:transposase
MAPAPMTIWPGESSPHTISLDQRLGALALSVFGSVVAWRSRSLAAGLPRAAQRVRAPLAEGETESRFTPLSARRVVESRERLGRFRWRVEGTLSWLNRFRRLKVRYERRADIHQAFLTLGCALICWRAVSNRAGMRF